MIIIIKTNNHIVKILRSIFNLSFSLCVCFYRYYGL